MALATRTARGQAKILSCLPAVAIDACMPPASVEGAGLLYPAVSGGPSIDLSSCGRQQDTSRRRDFPLRDSHACGEMPPEMARRQMDAHGSQGADRGGQLKHQRAAAASEIIISVTRVVSSTQRIRVPCDTQHHAACSTRASFPPAGESVAG